MLTGDLILALVVEIGSSGLFAVLAGLTGNTVSTVVTTARVLAGAFSDLDTTVVAAAGLFILS